MKGVYGDRMWRAVKGETDDGLPFAIVSRVKEGRQTTYLLVKRPTGVGPRWFNAGPQQISTGRVRKFPEKKGVRLTDSRLDRALIHLAEAA